MSKTFNAKTVNNKLSAPSPSHVDTHTHDYNHNHKSLTPHTPLHHPKAQHIIDDINEEHVEDLANFLLVFKKISPETLQNKQIELRSLYHQGLDICLYDSPKTSQNLATSTYFIAFKSPVQRIEELQLQIVLLKQKADKKIGKKTIKLTEQFFEVKDSYYVSKNMLRLLLSPLTPTNHNHASNNSANHNNHFTNLPTDEAGYAYLFDLTTYHYDASISDSQAPQLKATSPSTQTTSTKKHKPRQHCYYTLRKAWQADITAKTSLAWIDIFIHGDTSGGSWATGLRAGDIIKSKREIPEKLAHLNALTPPINHSDISSSQHYNTKNSLYKNESTNESITVINQPEAHALLIVDETSMPTAARLLELWQHPIPPLIICVTQAQADQSYLEQVTYSNAIMQQPTIIPLISSLTQLETLADCIDNCLAEYLNQHILTVDRVWGGLETKVAKKLRRLLQQRLKLTRSEIVIKGYWKY